MFKPGSTIVVCNDLIDPSTVKKVVFKKYVKEGSTTYIVTEQEEFFWDSMAWPESYYQEVIDILQERKDLKAAYEDSIKLIYQLNNRAAKEQQ